MQSRCILGGVQRDKAMICFSIRRRNQPNIEVPKKMKPMLKEFQRIVHDDLLDEQPPMRDIQHHIDPIPGASAQPPTLPNKSKGE